MAEDSTTSNKWLQLRTSKTHSITITSQLIRHPWVKLWQVQVRSVLSLLILLRYPLCISHLAMLWSLRRQNKNNSQILEWCSNSSNICTRIAHKLQGSSQLTPNNHWWVLPVPLLLWLRTSWTRQRRTSTLVEYRWISEAILLLHKWMQQV